LTSAERKERARIKVIVRIFKVSFQTISKSSKPNPQSSDTGEALIITDDNGRIWVGDGILFDAIDGIGDGEDEDACGGCDDERVWDLGIYSSIESSETKNEDRFHIQ